MLLRIVILKQMFGSINILTQLAKLKEFLARLLLKQSRAYSNI